MSTGQLQLNNQKLSVILGDGQLARIGSVVSMSTPPGPLISSSGVVMQWIISGIIVGPLDVLVSGGPVNNTLSAAVNSVRNLKLIKF